MFSTKPVRICLFGAAGDTQNLGVSALMLSALSGIARRVPHAQVTVFDNGWGVREGSMATEDGDFRFERCGARLSRRLHRPESLFRIGLSIRLGRLGNPGARAVLDANAVWDVSGGDSFTDMYGSKRFQMTCAPKRLAILAKVPLLLLPQTYGPFSNAGHATRAGSLVRASAMAWARDTPSFEELRGLLGSAYDPEKHLNGVDMAFTLAPMRPKRELPAPIDNWLTDRSAPIVGINVSGLVYNDPDAAAKFGLRADYRSLVRGLLRKFLDESDARILLIPHVLAAPGMIESDPAACMDLAAFARSGKERLAVLNPEYDPQETKWLISKLDWFCGTRMHSTIAALSSGVPTAAVAYSPKTKGVFETCAVGEMVVDPRRDGIDELLRGLWNAWLAREETATVLRESLPRVFATAETQLDILMQRTTEAQ